ncbi:MAG: TlpA disulfide reductase family protein [Verrucomicrobiota bacterium]|jgi:peroxiredoxin
MRSNNNVLSLAGLILAAVWTGLFAAAGEPADNAVASSQSNPLSPKLHAKEAGAAWTELTSANHHPPPVPPEWNITPPTAGEREKFYLPYIEAMADKSRDFYTRFPIDTNAAGAKLMEFQLLLLARQWGQTNQMPRIEAVGNLLLNDPAMSGERHFQILWTMALNSPPNKARPLFQEIINGAAPDKLKTAAAVELKKLDAVGKPLDVRFTAVDGRNVDLVRLRGKVVLVDFWATWCPPCVAEVPEVKKTYDQFHDRGFEIVGISLDKDKDKLTQFVAAHKMEWPQFFDGLYWQNKYAVQFGIESIPAMWLIDKKGLLRNVDARADLDGAVQNLLSE